MGEPFVCTWHHHSKGRGRPSNWEQQTIGGKWERLCNRCATRRLRNPLNALLPMRPVAPAPKEEKS